MAVAGFLMADCSDKSWQDILLHTGISQTCKLASTTVTFFFRTLQIPKSPLLQEENWPIIN